MFYCSLKDNANEATIDQFNQVYKIVDLIRTNKDDLVYKSSIPRMKQTKLRGIQAFKEVIKKLLDESKIKYDEKIKNKWLECFKIVYNYNSFALNINGVECITFDKEISKDYIKEKFNLDDIIYAENQPNNFEHTEDFINAIFDYIMAEKLKEKDLIKLINKLFNVLC
jgi:hypothetical protein